ncbi:MAG TPA: AAA family ATPase [Anaerohalosphaeraceae bacterium]|nr:AAA family ATPase [Anaerohalosphaeraceae bacterium]
MDELKEKAVALYKAGKSLSEIGKELFGGGKGAHFKARALLKDILPETETAAAEEPENPAEAALAALADALKDLLKVEAAGPQKIAVEVKGRPTVEIDGAAHKRLKDLLRLYAAGERNLYLVGPAGSGKTTLAKQTAQALNLPFAFLSLSAGVSETHLFGRVLPNGDGAWQFQTTQFLAIYENGGVFLFDEIDAADPNLLVHINSALANGAFANPINGRTYKRHTDCVLIAAANTFGTGANAQYVGRNALDAATLDRFVAAVLVCDYDRDLERRIAESYLDKSDTEKLLQSIWHIRNQIEVLRLRRICSTRFVEKAARLKAAGYTMDEIFDLFFVGWSADEINRIPRNYLPV